MPSSALSMALSRSSVFYVPPTRPSAYFHSGVWNPTHTFIKKERYSFTKSTTSKQQKVFVTKASADGKYGDDAPVERASAYARSSIWGDFFLAYEAMEPFPEKQEQQLKQLREEILAMLKGTPDGSTLKLELIDVLQRLGVSYLFEEEIASSLSNIYNSYHEKTQNDLHSVALRFRLLRHHGHYVSTDGLKKFTNKEGEFDQESLANDVPGLLSLYEASFYSVHEENILDEAMRVTTSILKGMVKSCSGFIEYQVNQALEWPIRKTLDRVSAREYILLYEQNDSRNDVLLKFAKLDFNRVQRLHQQELCHLTQWWKGIDPVKNYPFLRERLVENYITVMALYFEPQYSFAREVMIKVLNTFTIIDDIYDAYGTPDELALFNQAIERWDIDAANELPPYMRPCYQFFLQGYKEMDEELAKQGRAGQLELTKELVKGYLKCSYKEAYRHQIGYLPTFDEYIDNVDISSGISFFLINSYMGMGDLVTEAVLDWMESRPLAILAASTINRLIDDIRDHEGAVYPTAVQCYMGQYGVSREESLKEIEKLICKSWKDLNNECLFPITAPLTILQRPLNHARMIWTMYKNGDWYSNLDSKTIQMIKSMLVDPVI